MFEIMVANNDVSVSKPMGEILDNAGYKVIYTSNCEEVLQVLEYKHIDLIVLDAMLPEKNGYELTSELRSCGINTPIIMISYKGDVSDRCEGLSCGADDYMVMPVDDRELLLRIAALQRRLQIVGEHKLHFGRIILDYNTMTVSIGDATSEIPKKEFMLLFKLLSFPGKIFTKRQLMDEIWDIGTNSDEHTVEVHISRLRERFRENDSFKIVTVRGLGYKAVVNKNYGKV